MLLKSRIYCLLILFDYALDAIYTSLLKIISSICFAYQAKNTSLKGAFGNHFINRKYLVI